jgi:hypothetical protein
MTEPAYAIARPAALRILEQLAAVRSGVESATLAEPLAPQPEFETIEAMIDAAFWASLRQEEGLPPKISLAFLPPHGTQVRLTFERSLLLAPEPLTRLAPAVESPGIHLGVWREGEELRVWGATRSLPPYCFVLEVVSPGLLVVKHSRRDAGSKFANVALLQGDQIKILDKAACKRRGAPALLRTLLGLDGFPRATHPGDVLVRLAVAMRAHGRGGALLVVPDGCESWRESVVWPMRYAVVPVFTGLADLLRVPDAERAQQDWHEALRRAIDAIAGLTAVDGATVLTDSRQVLAFGTTIGRRHTSDPVERVLLSEPVEGDVARLLAISELGGTRHQSAAQFVHDQRDAVALVASKDGLFSLFSWSGEHELVEVHRVEGLLL